MRTLTRLFFPLLALTFGGALCACRSDIDKGIESANQLFFEQRYARAEALYRRTLKRLDERDGGKAKPTPELLVTLNRLGRINSLYLHNYDQAVSDFARLVAEYPETEEGFEAQATIADIYENRLVNLPQAAAELQRLVRKFSKHPDTAKHQLRLVELYFRMKNYEQAELAAQELINVWPESAEVPKARFNIAQVNYVMGRMNEALAEYVKLIETYPTDSLTPLVQFEMASCYQELGDPAKALEVLFQALKTHPHPQVVQRKIARIRRREKITAPSKTIAVETARAASRPAAVGERPKSAAAPAAKKAAAPDPDAAPEPAPSEAPPPAAVERPPAAPADTPADTPAE